MSVSGLGGRIMLLLERAVVGAAVVLALVVCRRWTEQWQSGIYHDMGDPALGACLGACTLAAVVLLFTLALATHKLDKRYWNTEGWLLSTATNCMYTLWDVLQASMNLVRVYSNSNFFLEHLRALFGFVRVQVEHSAYLRDLGLNARDYRGITAGAFVMECGDDPDCGELPECSYRDVSGNSLHVPISGPALRAMWAAFDAHGLTAEGTLFIDLGCGNGLAVLSAMSRPFDAILGVDNSPESLRLCRHNLATYADYLQRNGHCPKDGCPYVYVDECNMSETDVETYITAPASPSLTNPNNAYPDTASRETQGKRLEEGLEVSAGSGQLEAQLHRTEDQKPSENPCQARTTAVCAFMYEPLWGVSKDQAERVYTRTITNLTRQCEVLDLQLHLFYFSSRTWMGDAMGALQASGGRLVEEGTFSHLAYKEYEDDWMLYRFPRLPPRAHTLTHTRSRAIVSADASQASPVGGLGSLGSVNISQSSLQTHDSVGFFHGDSVEEGGSGSGLGVELLPLRGPGNGNGSPTCLAVDAMMAGDQSRVS